MHLRSLTLENFRCFRQAAYEFPRLTLLAGRNSSGKSTVINAVLMVLQGSERESHPFVLTPNGDLCTLGGYRDIAHGKKMRSNIRIGLRLGESSYTSEPKNQWDIDATYEYQRETRSVVTKKIALSSAAGAWSGSRDLDGTYSVTFQSQETPESQKMLREMWGAIGRVVPAKDDEPEKRFVPKFSQQLEKSGVKKLLSLIDCHRVFQSEVLYIQHLVNASQALTEMRRTFGYLGPGRLYPDRFYFDRTTRQARVGPRGENVPGVLFRWQQDEPEKVEQVVKYLRQLRLAVNLRPAHVKSNVLQVMINVSTGLPDVSLEDVGFGLSQLLPMIVLDVELGKGGTFLMSQPELHVHPSAQAAVAEYLLRRTKDLDRQYVVETHSEYLINRFRVLVAKGEIPEEEIALYYLSIEGDEAKTTRVHIKKDGSLDGAPPDFFETYRVDAFNLAMSI